MNPLILITLLFSSNLAFAGTEPKSSAQTPFLELYKTNGLNSSQRLSQVQMQFLNSFFSLLSTLRDNKLSLEKWFREDHIVYLLDFLTDDEKLAMIPIFETIGARIKHGMKDMKTILIGAGPAVLMAKAAKVDLEVLRLKEMHKDVIRFALTKHEYENNQRYGVLPYSYHLRKVRGVLKRFGFGPKDSIFGLKLGTAAWLHDVIEDTDATFEEISELFGKDIANIVIGVTKMDKETGKTAEEMLRLTYARTKANKGSRILKLADRIANVEEGILDLFAGKKSKVQKYFSEFPIFKELLYVPGDSEEMWQHLEGLLTDLTYAQTFAVNNIHKFKDHSCDANLELPR